MAAKLINCTKEEQRSVIHFLWAAGVPGAQIHLRMCAQYGDNVLSHRIVYEWTEMFKKGRTSVTDAERSGRQATATTSSGTPKGLFSKPIRNVEQLSQVQRIVTCFREN
jgi:hypothetical protein